MIEVNKRFMFKMKLRFLKQTLIDLGYIVRVILPQWCQKQRRLISRRQGIMSHIHLTRVFHEIGEDPFVKEARNRGNGNGYGGKK